MKSLNTCKIKIENILFIYFYFREKIIVALAGKVDASFYESQGFLA